MFGKKPEIYRQGDVLLVKVDDLPQGKDVTPEDRIVLAYGEITGHAHAVYPEVKVIDGEKKQVLPAKLWDAGAERYLQVLEKTALKHEEHAPIDLPVGNYKVIQQREYDPQMNRLVAD